MRKAFKRKQELSNQKKGVLSFDMMDEDEDDESDEDEKKGQENCKYCLCIFAQKRSDHYF